MATVFERTHSRVGGAVEVGKPYLDASLLCVLGKLPHYKTYVFVHYFLW